MAINDGAKSFCASVERGVPLTLPYTQDPNDTEVIRVGSPVALSSGNTIRRAQVTSGVISETKLLGFAANNPLGDTSLGQEFSRLPLLKDRHGRNQVLVYVIDGNTRFSMAVKSGVTGSEALVGTLCNFREEGTDEFVIDTASTANQLALVTAVHPSDLGKNAPRLDFIVPLAKSSYLTGA